MALLTAQKRIVSKWDEGDDMQLRVPGQTQTLRCWDTASVHGARAVTTELLVTIG